jgi:hypothetical protein
MELGNFIGGMAMMAQGAVNASRQLGQDNADAEDIRRLGGWINHFQSRAICAEEEVQILREELRLAKIHAMILEDELLNA